MPAVVAPPILHILAGPNGAGKTTLYEAWIRRLTDAAFVNADRLCLQALGHHALTREDAALGQRLANERREALLAVGASLVTETTFSHPSKLDLITRAQALGYRIVVYHVNVATADFAVARVMAREGHGGHPVPEANVRGRYERNQPLIRQAVLMADRAFVFDNSALGEPPRRLISFVNGHAKAVAPSLPDWAAMLYALDIEHADEP
ncbi:MAG: zeta toxin family protein [Caulobacteraceae bacterium]|nr:zeta toxin family protein [Caulobacteraceae bacterium]